MHCGTASVTKVSIKNSTIHLVRQVHPEEQGLWRRRPGSRPRLEPEFEFIFALMTLIPYSIPEKKLWPEGGILNYVCSAQILGFDILLMKNLKPMLLEVNANPSMRIEHEYEVSDRIIPWTVDLGGGPLPAQDLPSSEFHS